MSYSIATLLTRNLQEVFGENDPARRRAAVQALYTEDGVFYDPSKGVYRGRDEIDRIAGEIRPSHLAQTSHAGVGWPVDRERLQLAQLEERVEAVQRLADSPLDQSVLGNYAAFSLEPTGYS